MRQRSPLWRLLAVLLGLTLLAAACGDDDDSATSGGGGDSGNCPDGMKIGFVGPLTGDAANLGINIRNGAKLAIDQWNDDNADCQVGLEEYDSQGDETQAPGLAQEAIDNEDVVALVGPAFSGESRQANPLFDEAWYRTAYKDVRRAVAWYRPGGKRVGMAKRPCASVTPRAVGGGGGRVGSRR